MQDVRIGTSGWLYKHWRGGGFYPEGLPQAREFTHYAACFDTVEINGSFYRLPLPGAPERWRDAAPEGFLFAWKYPRWLTHYYRLKDPAESYKLVFGRMQGLGEKRGPALLQLPPQLKHDYDRLARALAALPKDARVSVEFRHPSWYAPDILRVMGEHNAALCISDHHHAPAPWETTADWVYVRGHGPGGRYFGSYDDAALQAWAKQMRAWRRRGLMVFCYFDNDPEGAAPHDALRLKAIMRQAKKRGARERGPRASLK